MKKNFAEKTKMTLGAALIAIAMIAGGCVSNCKTIPEDATPGTPVEVARETETTVDTPAETKTEATSDEKTVYTVEELFTKREELKGKTISVRGKVTKYNPMIMGKNWVHVQDGTGASGTNDITITTSQGHVNAGDSVLATGTLVLDAQFGGGMYSYEVLIENATLVRE